MDAKTTLAALFTLAFVGAAVAWTASDRFARDEAWRLLACRSGGVPSDSPAPTPSPPRPPHSSGVRLRIDPGLPPDLEAAAECFDPLRGEFARLAMVGYAANELTRLRIGVRADSQAFVSMRIGRWNQHDDLHLTLPSARIDGQFLETSGAWFVCVQLEGEDRSLCDFSGTLTLGSEQLEPGACVPLRLDVSFARRQQPERWAWYRVDGLASIEFPPEADAAQRAK